VPAAAALARDWCKIIVRGAGFDALCLSTPVASSPSLPALTLCEALLSYSVVKWRPQ
jgi:hypothetical protein